MTKFEDNISPYLSFVEGAAPSSPAATNFRLYYDSADHLLKWKNSAGTVSTILTGASGIPVGHGVIVRHNANQSISNNSISALAFNTEVQDTDVYHDTVTNNSRLTVPTAEAGWYVITYSFYFASNTTGIRDGRVRINGTTNIGALMRVTPAQSGNVTGLSGSVIAKLAAADYVELMVYQDSGGALNVNSDTGLSPEFAMVLIGS